MRHSSLPKVVVLMAAYNGVPWIKQQIDSILNQTQVEVTLFISVDLSVDGTEEFVDRIASQDNRVVVLPHGAKFGGAGPNFYRLIRDVNFSNFDCVAFADQDDIWLSNKLSRACVAISQLNAEAFSNNVTALWSDGRQMLINKSQPQVRWDFLFEAAGPGCTYVLSARLAKDIQQFVTSHVEQMQKIALHDWFMYAYARSKGYLWVIDAEPSMLYRQHSQNQVGANTGFKAFFYRVNKVLRGWGLSQSATIAKAIGLLDKKSVGAWLSGTRIGYLRLAGNFWQCRRRFRDKFFFLGACLLLALLGTKIDQN